MRSKSWILSLLAGTALLGSLASADELKMAPAPQNLDNQPKRGMSMEKVESLFGSPTNRAPAVGQPPITRWEYPGFIVYFEHNLVLHSVVKPQN
jgi:hypothetical protein